MYYNRPQPTGGAILLLVIIIAGILETLTVISDNLS
jgi:hypothetical protein